MNTSFPCTAGAHTARPFARGLATAALALFTCSAVHAQASCGAEFNLQQQPSPVLKPFWGSLPIGNPKPGPEILHREAADAPQLHNTGPWRAQPILVTGTSAYRNGEFVYQDHLFDDTGARGTSVNPGAGTYTYPTRDDLYARNAADLVELRLKPVAGGTAFRLTYNTMIDANLAATTVALGAAAGAVAMPHGANATAPAELFVTVHGAQGHAIAAATGAAVPDVSINVLVDLPRRQIHFCVPHQAFDPRGKTGVRVAAATGLWDTANGRYLVPGQTASATAPGGANPAILANPTAFFNAAFRFEEPVTQFRTSGQGTQLAKGDLSPYYANVDFVKLAAGVNDDMAGQVGGVPKTGYMNRILASHFEQAQGRGTATTLRPDQCPPTGCEAPAFASRLQPYEIYVPATRPPYGLMLHPHAAGGSHNFYIESGRTSWQPAAAARGKGSIVVTGNARGPQYWYYGQAAVDIFEIWADVARRYPLDPRDTVMSGLSMGGFGAFKLASMFPDLFSAFTGVVPCVFAGAASEITAMKHVASSLRHVPVIAYTATNDTLCTYPSQTEYFGVLDTLGLRYTWYSMPGVHASFDNEFQLLVDYVGNRMVVRDPAHITFAVNHAMNEPAYGLVADHAYWVSGVKVRDTSGVPALGKVDLFSAGFGVGDPTPQPTIDSSGVLVGAYIKNQTSTTYTARAKEWGPTPTLPVENKLYVTATNVSEMTIDPGRARLTCAAQVVFVSDGPSVLKLAGCGREVNAGVPAASPTATSALRRAP